jgi:hypothetical protein
MAKKTTKTVSRASGRTGGSARPAAAAPAPALPTHEEIARRAHEIFLARGGAPGRDMDDWLKAEQELTRSSSR